MSHLLRRAVFAWLIVAALLALLEAVPAAPASALPSAVVREVTGLEPDAGTAVVDSRTGRLYAVNERIDQVQVFDPSGVAPPSAVLARGDGPRILRLDSALRLLVVLYTETASLAVFDLAADDRGADASRYRGSVHLPTGCKPRDVALAPSETAFVVGAGCGAFVVADLASLAVTTEVPGTAAGAVAVDATRNELWTAEWAGRALRAFDLTTLGETRSITGPVAADEILLDLDAFRLFVLSGYDLVSVQVRDSVAFDLTGGQGETVDADIDYLHHTLFTLSRTGTLTGYDLTRPGLPARSGRLDGIGRCRSLAVDAQLETVDVLCPREGVVRVVG
ncbi:hypothetical protein SCB71_00160 [Herbiconiux sp. KACC 21604]|uniref:YncE family protein n=1 Tax=unclassified Herbiconiux TaxID=2618217 RepID=UPI0014909B16|nr:hypothetical protein [Herbiconiux sp. SALV-R1]QJU55500.1 hypothetical protein HL652_19015 [Herbiconiux sp. SALV-R1]WPO86685.1 hypothetical protein SCB71_00160 [Herbiconiux sp. KACC 21604]